MIKVSESLNGAVENFLEVTPEVISHMADKENPHAVTKEQIGLHFVKNEEQATAAEFQAHISGEGNKHSADDILYSSGKTVKEKLDEVQNGSGTIDHAELINRNAAAAHPISAIEGLEEKIEEFESLSAAAGEIEKIKTEMEKGPIYLTGKCKTTDYYTYHQIPISGDERFIKDGGITMPQGSAALIEAEIIAVTKEGEHAIMMNFFKYSGRIMNHNGTVIYVLKQYTAANDEYFAYQLPADDLIAPPPLELQISDNGERVLLEAKGDSMYDLTWKATVTIKNYTEIEA